jgi:hypothetical protein
MGTYRIGYKVQNADTAEWLARTTGKILLDDEIRHIQRNKALAETTTGERGAMDRCLLGHSAGLGPRPDPPVCGDRCSARRSTLR